ncbi:MULTISPECIES: MarR family winged helix-turn-helix transcriptional regulator [Streptomyces]|uniref:MarR family winged helix-turn-helix transcriptional regulator n=1 Tax=Streptomyces TaxID=1883 RepID=UPI00163BAF79|nr:MULTISPECIES: MarR family transcriptional regulator [Streptomyces]MBC2876442.1 MarR family transcriptional regulator [Streptomyces sp. TYQ1024]UBI40887.1 MarR family transcriptional regulator [Streptomyces mobaraensis]
MSTTRQPSEEPGRASTHPRGTAFLLAQIGAHAAGRFGERVAALGLTPPDVGLLRMIANRPGLSQRALAADLGVVPSRVVTLVDHLDGKGLVERRRSTEDRRNHALHLSPGGRRMLEEIGEVAAEHEADICAGLDAEERATLTALLERVAARQGLTPGVHPGYRGMAKGRPR